MHLQLCCLFAIAAYLPKRIVAVQEDCTGLPITTNSSNGSLVQFACNHWSTIHGLVDELLYGRSNVSAIILSQPSFYFFGNLLRSAKVTISFNNNAHFNNASNIIFGSSSRAVVNEAQDIQPNLTLDIVLEDISNRKAAHAVVLLDNNLGISRKVYMKHLVTIKTEIHFKECSDHTFPDTFKDFRNVIMNCRFQDTKAILIKAMAMELFTESLSWLILSEDTTSIEAVFQSGNPEVVADIVLLQKSDCIRVNVESFNTTCNTSQFMWEHVQETIHMTRVQKICRELVFQNTHFQLGSLKDLGDFHVLQTLSGCAFQGLAVDAIPYFTPNSPLEKSGRYGGIDVNFMDFISDALKVKVEYALFDFETVYSLLLPGNMDMFQMFDVMIPFHYEEKELLQLVDFSAPLFLTFLSALIKTPAPQFGADNSVKSYFLPFTPMVWVSVLVVTISTAVTWTLMRNFHPAGQEGIIIPRVYDVISALPLQGVSVDVPGIAFKITLAAFSMFALINISAYTAGLISFLTNARITIPFKTFDEFFQNDKFAIYQLTEMLNQATYSDLVRDKKLVVIPVGNRYSSLYETMGDSVFVMPTEICDYITMVYKPQFTQVYRHIIKWDRRMMFKKNFPHHGRFLKTARKLYEAGLYKKIHSEHLFLMKIIEGKPQTGHMVKAIHIDTISILFEALACLVFSIEIMIPSRIG